MDHPIQITRSFSIPRKPVPGQGLSSASRETPRGTLQISEHEIHRNDGNKETLQVSPAIIGNDTKRIPAREASRMIDEILKDVLPRNGIAVSVSCSPSCPPLRKVIVIPGVLNHDPRHGTQGLPFVRAYAKVLGPDYGISPDTFLDFIDELNTLSRGNLPSILVEKVGKSVDAFGSLDPTNITSLVGKSISLAGKTGRVLTMETRKRSCIQNANERLFNPKGLKVRIVKSKELRRILGLRPDAPLCAPLQENWTVPLKEEMKTGKRAIVRVPYRQILALLEHVQDIMLAEEASRLVQERAMEQKGSRRSAWPNCWV